LSAVDADERRSLEERDVEGQSRNRVRFLRVTLRRLALAAEIYHLRELQKIPQKLDTTPVGRRHVKIFRNRQSSLTLGLPEGDGGDAQWLPKAVNWRVPPQQKNGFGGFQRLAPLGAAA